LAQKTAVPALCAPQVRRGAADSTMTTVITPAAKKAFAIFDVDGSGSISADELVKILTRDTPAGKPLTKKDAQEIINDFDRRGAGELNLEDFCACWAIIGGGSSVSALENHSLYHKAIEAPGVKKEISRIFKKMDVSGDGSLELDELQEIIAFFQGGEFDADEFFGYWDVQGADESHVGAMHDSDHKSNDIDEREFGWYLADYAGLADYGDGSLDSYDSNALAHTMKATIEQFDEAIEYVQQRQKARGDSLHVSSEMRTKYQDILSGHRKQIATMFDGIDADRSGSLDVEELRDIVKVVEGRQSFHEDKFMAFFNKKKPEDTLSQLEFSWYVAEKAGSKEAMPDFLEKMKHAIQKVHDQYIIDKKERKSKVG